MTPGTISNGTPAAVIQSATTGAHRQFISTLGKIALESEHAGFGAPAIVVIGEVVKLSEQLTWFVSRAGFSPPLEVQFANESGLKPALLA